MYNVERHKRHQVAPLTLWFGQALEFVDNDVQTSIESFLLNVHIYINNAALSSVTVVQLSLISDYVS